MCQDLRRRPSCSILTVLRQVLLLGHCENQKNVLPRLRALALGALRSEGGPADVFKVMDTEMTRSSCVTGLGRPDLITWALKAQDLSRLSQREMQ